ncbi:MAG: hypothetical protein HQK51_14305 [Oligoflexia bacterium]|nr:hypothetical protein [Oligoflexia bacterium]
MNQNMNQNNNVESDKYVQIVVRDYDKEESFQNLLWVLGRMNFYLENKYVVPLPNNKSFKELAENPEKINTINTIDKEMYYEIFLSEIYKPIPTDIVSKIINNKHDFYSSIFIELKKLNKNWNFKIFDVYNLILVLWSPGGSYHTGTGAILRRVDEEGRPDTTFRQDFNDGIVHEIIHIGIEEVIVRKYKLEHWEKEFLVDTICKLYLGNLMPQYHTQSQGKNYERMNEFVTYNTIQKNLPEAIQKYFENKV